MTWLPQDLRDTLLDLGPRTRGFRYPQDLRLRLAVVVRDALDQGISKTEITTTLRISWGTLKRWIQDETPARPQFIPLTISTPPQPQASSIRLRSPSGWLIEGLSLAQAQALIAGLS